MRVFLFVFCCFAILAAEARVPVEDRSQPSAASGQTYQVTTTPAAPPVQPLPPPSSRSDTFTKMQMLQDEVMELRGLVEQLGNEVRLLKKRQADDYMDLDRRISSGAGSTSLGGQKRSTESSPVPAQGLRSVKPSTASRPASAAKTDYEVNHYSAAYGLLKDGKIPEATKALQKHIQDFPNGKYTPNCYYWLGEIYLLENKLSPAKAAFSQVVQNYPAHRKAPDATFKLGKVLHLLGDTAAAKAMLTQAVQGGGSAGKLAEKYLSDNF